MSRFFTRRRHVHLSIAIAVALVFGVGATVVRAQVAGCSLSPSGGGVVYVDKCPAANIGAAIQSGITALGGQPGIIDARGYAANLEINAPIVLGRQYQSIQLLLPARLINVRAPIYVGTDSSIVGAPVGMAVNNAGIDWTSTTLYAVEGARLPVIVQVGFGLAAHQTGSRAVLQDIVVNGNGRGGATGTVPGSTNILVLGGTRIDMTRVSTINSAGDGIQLKARPEIFHNACCAKLTKVMAENNAGTGLSLIGQSAHETWTNDTFVNQSEFENNGWAGINLHNASALRITNSDLGGNYMGIHTDGNSWAAIITGNQFGGQKVSDIVLTGTGYSANVGMNTITGNQFLGIKNGGTADMISITNSTHNNFSANTINLVGSKCGIRFSGVSRAQLVSSNVFVGGGMTKAVAGDGVTKDGNVAQ